ncbi:hypothetical protein KJ840_00690 [Patescibacteria group bacterium]|nr:hypothetical protein [Patescibacteria group bacterium]
MSKNHLEQPNTSNEEQEETKGSKAVDPQEILNKTTTVLNELRERKAQIQEQIRTEVAKKLNNRENLIKQGGEKVESLEQAQKNLDLLILESRELLNGLGDGDREVFEAQRSEIERLIASLKADLEQIDEQIKEIEVPEVVGAMHEEATKQNVIINEAIKNLEGHQGVCEQAKNEFSELKQHTDEKLGQFENKLNSSSLISAIEDLKSELTRKQNSTFFIGREKREARVAEIKELLRKKRDDLYLELRNITSKVFDFRHSCEESLGKFYYNAYEDADKSGSTILKSRYKKTNEDTEALIEEIKNYSIQTDGEYKRIAKVISGIFEIKKS